MNMTEDELFAVLDRVADMVLPECDREPGEFSAPEYGARHGITGDKARDLLDSMVNDGRLIKRQGRNLKRASTWYRIAG